MQVYRALQSVLLLTLLLVSTGCASQTQSNNATVQISDAEFDQMLAPVALYPDSVLTHVLIAATYPLEVVQAARWLEQNPNLTAEMAVEAASLQDWDPSVQALTAFPQLLNRLNEDLQWTQQLGEAFLTDEAALLASIQRLRERAYAQGSLRNSEHVIVERQREVIVIEPARREVIYVPYYDTRVVYGNWWWPTHPPVYWHGPAAYRNQVSFYWGSGFQIRPSFYFSIFDWQHRHVVVQHNYYYEPPRYYPKRQHFHQAPRWQHDQYHRRGVYYRQPQIVHRNNHWRDERKHSNRPNVQPEQNVGSFIPADSRLRQSNVRREQEAARQAQRSNASTTRPNERERNTGRIAEKWAENEQRTQPITAPVTSQVKGQQDRVGSERIQPFNRHNEHRIQPIDRANTAIQQPQPRSRNASEQRIQPVARAEQEQRIKSVLSRNAPEQRVQPVTQPVQQQRISSVNRSVPEQRVQPVTRPVQEQRMQRSTPEQRAQPVMRPVQEPRTQPVTRPVQEQRIQSFNRSAPEQRAQPATRPVQEQRIRQRPDANQSARVEANTPRQQQQN
ncbi:DUF3300 domain-containing protein [Alishewanella sp. 16-MA]|uniref:DUF3300 domain-containing protein n=1 Tax=Alishewanella maricola TaxID=2795740 RepID=A0ABS8C4J9_9ALTE|nr:DUF3300 domain-containing protein [Alishewanella maricola]MCB5227070.1 DUF3300 domain-containing protein [Alishewanella maricola]